MKRLPDTRCGEIDFWKFIYSLIIVLHHSYKMFDGTRYYFSIGSICVEFFFIVTGYLFASSISRIKTPCSIDTLGSETSSFIFHKIKGFIYYYIFSCIVCFAADCAADGIANAVIHDKIHNSVFNLLFMNMAGLPYDDIFHASWYLSAMLIALMVLYPIARRFSNMFINVIAPLTALFLYGIMMKTDGNLVGPEGWHVFIYKGVIRAFAGICLGATAFRFSGILKAADIGKLMSHVLSIADVGLMIIAITYVYININTASQPFIVFAFFLTVVIATSKKASISKLFGYSISQTLGKLSTTIFLSHQAVYLIYNALEKYFPYLRIYKSFSGYRTVMVISALAAAVLLGIICMLVCDAVKKKADSKRIRKEI